MLTVSAGAAHLQILLVLPCCTLCSAPLAVLVLHHWLPLQVQSLRAELDAVNDDRLRLRGDLAEVKEQVRDLPLRLVTSSTHLGVSVAQYSSVRVKWSGAERIQPSQSEDGGLAVGRKAPQAPTQPFLVVLARPAAGYCILTMSQGQAELCCTSGAACAGATGGVTHCGGLSPEC